MSAKKPQSHTKSESSSDKAAFVAFVIGVFQAKGTRLLRLSMKDVSEAMQELPRVCPVKNFTNQHGNLKGVMTRESFTDIFEVTESVIALATPAQLRRALEAGTLTEELAAACLKMHADKDEADAEARRLNPHLYPAQN